MEKFITMQMLGKVYWYSLYNCKFHSRHLFNNYILPTVIQLWLYCDCFWSVFLNQLVYWEYVLHIQVNTTSVNIFFLNLQLKLSIFYFLNRAFTDDSKCGETNWHAAGNKSKRKCHLDETGLEIFIIIFGIYTRCQ